MPGGTGYSLILELLAMGNNPVCEEEEDDDINALT